MTTPTYLLSGDNQGQASFVGGNDGTVVVQTGAFGAKVNALTLDNAGNASVVGTASVAAATAAGHAMTKSAVETLVGGATPAASLKAASGYQKMPSGVIIQWGYVASGGGSSGTTVTFPIAFTATPSVTITSASAVTIVYNAASTNTTTTTVYSYSSTTGGGAAASPFFWMAIGY